MKIISPIVDWRGSNWTWINWIRACWIGLLPLLLVGGCTWYVPPPIVLPGAGESLLIQSVSNRQPVYPIPLQGPVASVVAEVSGLAWYGDTLILLPQFPNLFGNRIYGLPKAELVAVLTGQRAGPLTPLPIALDDEAIQRQVSGSEGYEAITFRGNRAFLTLETLGLSGMLGYVVMGEMAPDLSLLRLDPAHLAPILPQADLNNFSDESILLIGDQVATIYEANGFLVNPDPVIHLFEPQLLVQVGTLPFPNIEYRITDATAVNDEGRFWIMNEFAPDSRSLRPFLRSRGAEGPVNEDAQPVERLLELQITPEGIIRTDRAPIALELLTDGTPNGWIARNWEGVVRLQTAELNGFLMVTDRFPATILAYVPIPE